MDPLFEMCMEDEKKRCLQVIQDYYKKNNHPSVLRLRDYLQGISVQDPAVLEDLEKIKIYISDEIIIDGSAHVPSAIDA